MEAEELKNLVAFLVLMQSGSGILGKAPSYIEEKFKHRDIGMLDSNNKAVFDQWCDKWLKEELVNV